MKSTMWMLPADVQNVISVSRAAQVLMLMVLLGCSQSSRKSEAVTDKLSESEAFKKYWYSGVAEINAYNLVQSRYGEMRIGKAVLIFVTEDFSKKKHVKLDDPTAAGDDKVSVLKMNFTKNFMTGIYPYSMMLSVFTPVERREYQHSLKASMSAQEWCGHVFSQMDFAGSNYSVTGHSYFEKEGEEKFSVKTTWLEDELWNTIRLGPGNLPSGTVELIPGLFFARLKHTNLQPKSVNISKTEQGEVINYSVEWPNQERVLIIHYEKQFPHKVLGWEETFTERGEQQQTTAALDKTLRLDYWTKNKNEFLYLRDSLGLSHTNY